MQKISLCHFHTRLNLKTLVVDVPNDVIGDVSILVCNLEEKPITGENYRHELYNTTLAEKSRWYKRTQS